MADDDLIALPFDGYISTITNTNDNNDDITSTNNSNTHNPSQQKLRLCVVRNQAQNIPPLVRREDDVETDLFLDPRYLDKDIKICDILHYWLSSTVQSPLDTTKTTDSEITKVQYYGIGWYGQRPVPSLGGGPGYGAEADEIWSIDEDMLNAILNEEESSVDVPSIDIGIAHGEKARGGALF